eukprot:3256800-Pleurochrysis_carterae.AAC.1
MACKQKAGWEKERGVDGEVCKTRQSDIERAQASDAEPMGNGARKTCEADLGVLADSQGTDPAAIVAAAQNPSAAPSVA